MQNTIRVERAKQNMTQGELAEAIGVSRQTIHAIETGKFAPSVITALKISQFFNTTVQEIFQLEDDEQVNPVED
ncbi:MAG: helix-turn-helix transcriptional regulator [Bacteroidales bacterium]|nr:helix-turn-helix transcriptional regulator [Bacteroidales bacterium]